VVKEGLKRANQPEGLIEHALQIAVGEVTQKVQARTAFLSTIANVATLLGLFGTIVGLVQSFTAVGSANAQQRSALLAQGISTAMNATMLGLAIAIPCMIAFSYLMNRTNRLTAEIDRSALRTMDLLKQRYYSHEAQMMARARQENQKQSSGAA
jgi:biopolymer transport protein ExbB/TolQ